MRQQHIIDIGIAFCTPIPLINQNGVVRLSDVSIQWHRSRCAIGCPTNIRTYEIAADGMEVGAAREDCVKRVLKIDPRPEFIFFLDYDVIPKHDCLQKLLYRARSFPDHDIFAGVYCTKSQTPEPLLYKCNGQGPFWDWAVGDLVFDLASVGMGCTLIRTSLFDRVSSPWFVTENWKRETAAGSLETYRGTEDIFFCSKAHEEADVKIMADTSVLCGHQHKETGTIYGLPRDSPPIKRSFWMDPEQKESDTKIALDIGAGATRRRWPGHVTKTTDIRPDTDADYVQDSLNLNIPDNSIDLVASSHHLEHFGRWDQETLWSSMYRILKPGGTMEHIVPNVQWAASHIADGRIDEHVMNVLYGAQEAHGYERELNTHFFGYTPEIARALAESCGLINVVVKTYKNDESLGYNMVITGEKPQTEPAKPTDPFEGIIRDKTQQQIEGDSLPEIEKSGSDFDHAARGGNGAFIDHHVPPKE